MLTFWKRTRAKFLERWGWIQTHAKTTRAKWILFVYTFFEALILPFPTEPFFALIVLANRAKAVWVVVSTTLASTLGATAGYVIGFLFSDFFIQQLLASPDLAQDIEHATLKIGTFAFLAVFLAAIAPVPFTPVILAAGLLRMDFLTFLAASVIGRGLRYGVVALVILFFGEDVINRIRRNGMPFAAGLFTLVLSIAIILFMTNGRG